MKKTRLLILTAVLISALFVTALPAFAVPPSPWDVYNLSFMGDKNLDNIPDKWNVKGDVFRTCDHAYFPPAESPCAMVFPPSGGGATLWQRIDVPNSSWEVLDLCEEGESQWIGQGLFAAKNMDWDHAFYGVRLIYNDGSKIVVYDDISGGWYNFNSGFQSFYAPISSYVNQDVYYGLVKYYDWGIVTLPHDGRLGVDWISTWLLGSYGC